MAAITRNQILGSLAAAALLSYFIVPPAFQLSGTACSLWSFEPTGCEAGVRAVFRVAAVFCLVAGFLVKRALSRQPDLSTGTAMFLSLGITLLLALPLSLLLHAAFW